MQMSTVEHFLRDLERAHDVILEQGLNVEPWLIIEGVASLYRTSWLRRRKIKEGMTVESKGLSKTSIQG